MKIAVIHIIILMAMSGLTKAAGVLPDGPLNVAVGETVMFNTTLTPQTFRLSVLWIFGETVIINYEAMVGNVSYVEYEGRMTLFILTGSLELRNVTSNDSGQYSVVIYRDGGKLPVGVTQLDVHDSSGGLSGGAIAGIVILCLAASSVGAGGGYYIYKDKINKNATPCPERKNEESVDENTYNVYDN